ncbi:MAG: DUF6062 family protein [Oscillospiraceae bacterium]|nr:DUF6062 family protein [Oscillospiraceae bacterium]
MKETIYTIPVSEVFEPKDGCPICRMRDTLEDRCVEYIMGAAMMEPDIRIETNKAGFCSRHFGQMLKCRNRLSLALMLESHLDHLQKEVLRPQKPLFGKDKRAQGAKGLAGSCYVCSKIDWAMERMLETTLRLWEKEESFRQLYAQQPVICLEHYAQVCGTAEKVLGKKAGAFQEVTLGLTRKYLEPLQKDVSHFCRMFDYRNNGGDWSSSRDSIERAVWYLTSRRPE